MSYPEFDQMSEEERRDSRLLMHIRATCVVLSEASDEVRESRDYADVSRGLIKSVLDRVREKPESRNEMKMNDVEFARLKTDESHFSLDEKLFPDLISRIRKYAEECLREYGF